MKFLIYGTGGVGGYFGTRLAEIGEDVTFVARGAHLKAIQEKGLKLKSIDGDFHLKNAKATDHCQSLGTMDVILVCVKSWQLEDAIKEFKSCITEKTVVIPLLNGVLAPEVIAKEIGWKHVMGGMCKIFSKIEEPGVINHFGYAPELVYGEMSKEKTERALKILEVMLKAKFKTELAEDIEAEMWKKFIYICSTSGLGALTRVPLGQFRDREGTGQMIYDIMSEIYQVAIKKGVKLDESIVDRTWQLVKSIDGKTTNSLQRDVMEGRPSELETQNGTVVRLGKELGIPTPVNAFVYNTLLPMELNARKQA